MSGERGLKAKVVAGDTHRRTLAWHLQLQLFSVADRRAREQAEVVPIGLCRADTRASLDTHGDAGIRAALHINDSPAHRELIGNPRTRQHDPSQVPVRRPFLPHRLIAIRRNMQGMLVIGVGTHSDREPALSISQADRTIPTLDGGTRDRLACNVDDLSTGHRVGVHLEVTLDGVPRFGIDLDLALLPVPDVLVQTLMGVCGRNRHAAHLDVHPELVIGSEFRCDGVRSARIGKHAVSVVKKVTHLDACRWNAVQAHDTSHSDVTLRSPNRNRARHEHHQAGNSGNHPSGSMNVHKYPPSCIPKVEQSPEPEKPPQVGSLHRASLRPENPGTRHWQRQ